jgi:predicted transcriptional regulator
MGTVPFSVRFDEKLKGKLEKLAVREDRSVGYIVQKAVEDYVVARNYFYREMAKAEKELDKGVFISGEKIQAWMESWDTENELPEPEPDIFSRQD